MAINRQLRQIVRTMMEGIPLPGKVKSPKATGTSRVRYSPSATNPYMDELRNMKRKTVEFIPNVPLGHRGKIEMKPAPYGGKVKIDLMGGTRRNPSTMHIEESHMSRVLPVKKRKTNKYS
jgi:hypothetical protein